MPVSGVASVEDTEDRECSTDAFACKREREQFPAIFSKRIPLDGTVIKIAPRLTHARVNNATRGDMCRVLHLLFSVVIFDQCFIYFIKIILLEAFGAYRIC